MNEVTKKVTEKVIKRIKAYGSFDAPWGMFVDGKLTATSANPVMLQNLDPDAEFDQSSPPPSE